MLFISILLQKCHKISCQYLMWVSILSECSEKGYCEFCVGSGDRNRVTKTVCDEGKLLFIHERIVLLFVYKE